MQRISLIVAGFVLVASLAGAAGPALAQSDDMVTLTIEVVNPSTNQRLGGVTLLATWDGGESRATTASNGMVFIDVPEAASVEITPDDPSYTRNEPYFIRVATEREHTIEVFRKADIDVSVRDAEGPVADARVALSQDGIEAVSGRTDTDGQFRSGTIAQGRYTVTVVKAGYYRTTQDVIVAGSPEETVQIERGRVDYDILVEDPHFDPAEPVSNATVSIEGAGESVTDDRGSTASLLPVNSELEVTVSKEGYESVTRTVTTNESAGSLAFELSREPGLSLTALNERTVVGEMVPVEVTNAYGEPASGVTILVDGEAVAQTDQNGRATVRIEEPGDRSLQARRGGTTSESVTVRGIGEGGATESGATTDAGDQMTGTETDDGSGGAATGLLGPIVALVGLLVVLALGVLYWRRREARSADPSAWADDPLASTERSGGVGFGDDTEPRTPADAEADTSDDSESERGASEPSTDDAGADAQRESGAAVDTEADAGEPDDTEADAEEPDETEADAGEPDETGSDDDEEK
ncbi:carboxypeptidase regulatory-like domain-containing protein [Salinigranum halophilum]|uniref:carboxypeptidase regulatory-like domain-containing protein n=1 Tax=Salinigranum halophilum TaxID=2565931 RepID=UPI0010A89455|nr:carboxypeptidase regulatory-like domain-containing protein [Salinigranum halophilum]